MSTFNDFYNIYKSSSDEKNAYNEFYANRSNQLINRHQVCKPRTHTLTPVKDSRCVVLIPVYKQHPNAFETHNLKNTFKRLSLFDICLLCPDSLNISAYNSLSNNNLLVFRKSDVFFRGKQSYSRMMESSRIYRALELWDYTLIVQPDVWIFGDARRLILFIESKPTYLGGPWTEDYCRTLGINSESCGNGGLSLRHNKRLIEILETSENRNERLKTVEDQYISYILYKEGLASKADDALPFAIDNNADYWHKRLGSLPWGIHMGNPEARAYWTKLYPDIFKPYEEPIIEQNFQNTGFVVSLTSFGERLKHDAPLVIGNILRRQTLLPDLIVLTVYKDDVNNIPYSIRKFERDGRLQIIVADMNLRPHLKYYYTMLEYPDIPIITIDDDLYYHPELFKELYSKWKKYPDCVIANRCHLIKYSGGRPLEYQKWEMEYRKITHPSDRLFATGVGGVLYPPGVFTKEDFDINEIKRYITTDDIYLKVLEKRKNIYVATLDRYFRSSYISSKSAVKERLCDQNTQGLQINNKNIMFGDLDINNYKKICYSVISGNYDCVIDPIVVTPGWQYIMFTDLPNAKSNIWDIRPLPKAITDDKTLNQVKRQRIMKIQPHLFLDYDICLWVDGNMQIKKNLDEFCKRLPDGQFAVAAHPDRDCIYDEAVVIARYRKDTLQNMAEQQRLYKEDGYPAHAGLCETNIMLRKNNLEVNELMDMWADWLRKYSHRDLMSLNYCMWKLGFEYTRIPDNIRHEFFQWRGHKGYRRQ